MLRIVLYILIFLLWPCGAAAKQVVYYAGQSYSAEHKAVASLFPYTHTALSQPGFQECLNDQIIEKIAGNPKYEFVDRANNADFRDEGKATVLALSIDNEIVSVEQISGKYKVLYEISAQALYFDFNQKQVLGSYPFTLAYIDLFDKQPTKQQIQSSVDEFLLRANNNPLVSEFSQIVNRFEIPNPAQKRIRVKKIEMLDDAIFWVPKSISPEDLKFFYGHEFSKYLSTNLGLPILPASIGQAVGNEMKMKFANGGDLDLQIPEEDFAIEVRVNWFKKLIASSNNIAQVYVFGAGTNIEIYESFPGKRVIFSSPMKLGETKTVPISQANVDDWAAISAVMSELFAEFSENIKRPDKSWMQTHLGSDKSKELKQLNKIIGESK